MQPSSVASPWRHTTPARGQRRLRPPSKPRTSRSPTFKRNRPSRNRLQPQYAPEPAAAAPAVGGTDMVTQLENLKKLLDDGVLTQAEFDMEKQKLLASS